MNWWTLVKDYYLELGRTYKVDPALFLGIHVVATPLFLMAIGWIYKRKKQGRSLLIPVTTALVVFNAANLYLVFWGTNIPALIYFLISLTTVISGYSTYRKVKAKVNDIHPR
ncbi:hypothetical protein [Pedobacter sp.]|uniref:hypothetical protein n=1 Tax=Pedobacter sp. TaxID=1411316 RepID=UPI003C4F486A